MFKCFYYFLIILFCLNFSSFAKSSNSIIITTEENEVSDSEDETIILIQNLLEKGNTVRALEKLHKYIEESEANNEINKLIKAKILLADIFRENGDYKKSTAVLDNLLPLVTEDFKSLEYVYFKKGGNFQKDRQIDSAKFYYEKSLFIGEKVLNNENLKAKIYANLAGIYYLKGDYKNAIKNYKIAASFQEVLGNKEIEAGILNNLGGLYYVQGEYKKALNNFKKAFDLVGYGQDDFQKGVRNNSYINMAYAYSGLKNFKKAFEYQDKYFSLNDSLQKELKYRAISEIESKYNLATQERENEIEKAKRKDAEVLTYGLSLAVILLLVGVYILFKLNKLNKKNHQLQIDQEHLINQSKIEKIKSDSQSQIISATLDGRLNERKKIASVLHDNVSALLSATNLHLFASKKKMNGNVPVEIEKAQNILEEASEQIRDLSHKLISSVLVNFGLSVAIHDLCEKSSNSKINLQYQSEEVGRFDGDFELKIFNITNECINNILKHSNAANGVVNLKQLKGSLILKVLDDGKGFNIDKIHLNNGVGLRQIEARIKNLKGKIDIISSENKGTQIIISVPIVN
ncbi:tetratricopeptide repeat-containing sensor histidine kinase [Lutibacter citreus]|uniref:tetratricopeptide repeat-containing sensor histidine kinase n=1 Tax=Lutibacter citreus TaxID=2138210 RepID=UPI000DBE602D|nr:tetratricopeptide repeat protein [Lutibacter citreus]